MAKCFFIVCMILFLIGCKSHTGQVERAFYYWKTVFEISPDGYQYLKDLEIQKLYVRFFDIDRNERANSPTPQGEIVFRTPPPASLKIIPVVYITTRTLQSASNEVITTLAENTWKEVQHIATANHITFSEFQLDCDWTESTRDNFFLIAEKLRVHAHGINCALSATIRLHQVKYYLETGIPPVDRGMLMFYNIGKISADTGNISIYNDKDASRYTPFIKNYPLPLDVALPVFSWAVQVRDKKVIGLVNKTGRIDYENSKWFHPAGGNIFIADSSFFFQGHYIMKSDLLKIEEIYPYICKKAAGKAADALKEAARTVALFDLDSLNLVKYEKKDFEEIFGIFN